MPVTVRREEEGYPLFAKLEIPCITISVKSRNTDKHVKTTVIHFNIGRAALDHEFVKDDISAEEGNNAMDEMRDLGLLTDYWAAVVKIDAFQLPIGFESKLDFKMSMWCGCPIGLMKLEGDNKPQVVPTFNETLGHCHELTRQNPELVLSAIWVLKQARKADQALTWSVWNARQSGLVPDQKSSSAASKVVVWTNE